MKKVFVLIFLFKCLLAKAQTAVPVVYPSVPIGQGLSSLYYDTISNILYAGGSFSSIGGISRQNIAAIDAATGNVLSFAPNVLGGVDVIHRKSDTIYIGGNFTSVNGNACQYFAALDTNGNFLYGHNFDAPVRSIHAYGDFVYVAGEFTVADLQFRDHIAEFNIATGNITSWNPTFANFSPVAVSKVQRSENKILAIWDPGGTSIQLEILSAFTGNYVDSLTVDFDVNDFFIVGNEVVVSGNFLSVSDPVGTVYPRDYFFKYDLTTKTILPDTYAIPFYPTGIAYYNDTLYLPNDLSNFQCDVIKSHPYAGSVMGGTTTGANPKFEFSDFVSGSGRIFYLFDNGSCSAGGGSNQIDGMCLHPVAPLFSVFTPSVCPGTSGVSYGVVDRAQYASYTWSYSGTGVTINGNGSTVALDFAANATGGLLSVFATTNCVYNTPVASYSITLYPLPVANAGADRNLTCDSSVVTLTGALTNPNLNFFWQFPGGGVSGSQQIPATSTGNYTLTVTNTVTACSKNDTVYVGIDTVKPVINPLTSSYVLTCTTTSVVLDGSSANALDSIWWTHQGGGNFSNPDTVSLTGTYLFNVKSVSNGCIASDTAIVTSNTVPPPLTMPPMDAMLFATDIITCDTPSISLNAMSSVTSTVFYWDNDNTPSNDSLANPLSVTYAGQFTCYVIDTSNGCSANGIIFTQVDTSKPALSVPFDTTYITCSATSVILDASSITPSASLTWTDNGSFSSSDPATVGSAGWFFVTALKQGNGCTRTDSVFIGVDSSLVVYCGNDTNICPGSAATYSVAVTGGTPPYNYLWSNGSSSGSPVFTATDTTEFSVFVTDQNNCKGRDTVIVNVADPINDSSYTYKPCDSGVPNGQITVFAYGGIPPYQFSIDSGQTFQSSNAFGGLNYGDYPVTIKDTLGCSVTDTVSINSQSFSMEAEFLIASNSFEDSVLVLVDICDPRPDSVWWDVPPAGILTGPDSSGTQFYLTLPDTGMHTVVMHALFGNCEDTDTALVNLIQWDSAYATVNSGFIDSVNVFPNPAPNGQFNLYVKLFKKQTFAIYLYNSSGTTPLMMQNVYDSDIFNNPLTIPNPSPGTYVIRIVAEYDSRYIIIVVP